MEPNCPGCYYLLQGKTSPTGRSWCGWAGGDPEPGVKGKCHPRPLGQKVPEGLVIARSLRVVSQEDLAAENESFADLTGNPYS